MPLAHDLPWFHAAVQLLDLRPHDRVLAVGCEEAQVQALATLVGKNGAVTAVADHRAAAHKLAATATDQVAVVAPSGIKNTRFGTFDALLVTAPGAPLFPLGRYVDLARANLRPGGRCVFDLPGEDMVPDLSAAASAAGWPAAKTAALRGIGDDALATALRSGGLRDVRGVLGAHLVSFRSPGDLVDRFAAALRLDVADANDLTQAAVRRAGGSGPFDALVHRTRVQALR